jgi:hypothetical protein
MQGFVVVPAVRRLRRAPGHGRLFEYDVTGGRYEESDFAATGSGSLHAGTVIKLGFSPNLDRDARVELAINALFQAPTRTRPPAARPGAGHLPGGGHHHGRRLRAPRRREVAEHFRPCSSGSPPGQEHDGHAPSPRSAEVSSDEPCPSTSRPSR